ncbi:PPPDE putative peptidase domain containing protein, putative [Trypanosoma equiperdum]|uniref:PPPDE domain-containing protein n=4 Tax=Trypanozoon TaxID=39700 RepID=Q382J0_TRYB2|nr:hypothetical protein, conserved [Trypanosoma brucei gambiense DAL972]XP_829403.1 hypothetical protein, conserved [Trypanosoma brucei brucei TREU927]RHW67532.1 PPPDE putative peptidase domain containing protein [Trypanosoma brucei equiperdum]SCU66288.1 PPPDE putative peptidase domain containing protein, putative [Trypanosoma equiperdum]EAN80291.1 hypothetical protein, conserved [Trypanosoma brucei brucei TREU927]CBH18384.1 hypothetical protein, conserved [Trypanosoma brucei gambiense DAL972]|eukprot:XP_011780648.1 hypothetical protein, conserved [Trypanosoma brucei gambiense DAL972]
MEQGQPATPFAGLASGVAATVTNILGRLDIGGNDRKVRSDLPPNTVFLNVYDITVANRILYYTGAGVHHTGVELYGMEFAFGRCEEDTGVFQVEPKNTPPHTFREQLVLGTTQLTRGEVLGLVQEMKGNRERWSGRSYHIVKNNCNSFSEAFAKRLLPPDVRYDQHQAREKKDGSSSVVEVYDNGEREVVRLSGGQSVEVPVLMPSWVNRLANTAERILGEDLVQKIDDIDRKAVR